MTCSACGGKTVVINTRPRLIGTYRRRRCIACRYRFSTIERELPSEVIKFR